jgi:site-specific recombinase XerD
MYARVCLKGLKAEERLTVQVSDEDLLKWSPMSMRFSDRNNSVNRLLNSLDQKFDEFIILNSSTLYQFKPRNILDHVLGKPDGEETSVLGFVLEYYDKKISTNIELSKGTIKNYNKSVNHLKAYLKSVNKEQITFTELNNTVAVEFLDYLKTPNPVTKKVGMTMVSASSVFKNFRPIFNEAILKGFLESNPFKAVKLKHKSPKKDRLTIFQVKQLLELNLDQFPNQKIYRDIFLFSVFTGLANKDAMSLKYSNLEIRTDGNVKLLIRRIKTDVHTESFLVSFAIEIISRYSDLPERKLSGSILPKRSNEKLNIQLKVLAGMANIPINLSSHIARHTFRQLLSESGIEDIGVIKRMMGQSRGDDIDDTYCTITETRLMEAKNRFESFLINNLYND